MRNRLTAVFFISTLSAALFALEVDVDEIKKAKKIKFINYRGRHKQLDTVRGITAIGKNLAEGVRKRGANSRYRYHMKYSIVHAVSVKEPEKLSADVFSIDREAKVGHIKNVRRIISGYLTYRYRYSARHARALAIFITYYNAVYRKDIKYFSGIYKNVVMKNMNSKNAGLATRYNEWPGRTRIIIPLTEQSKRGDIDSIDPFIISDKKTRDKIRKDDKAIDKRKDLIDIKEKIIKKDKSEIEKKEKKIEKKKKKIAKKKEAVKKKEEQIKKEKKEAAKITDPVEKKKKEEEIKKKEKKITDEKKEIKKEEKKISDEKKKVEEKKKDIEKKKEQVKEEKKEIAQDELKKEIKKDPEKAEKKLEKKQQDLIKKEKELDKREDELRDKIPDKKIFAMKLYYLKIREYLEGGHYNNELVMIDAATQKILFKSPVTNISGRRYDIFSEGIVVITHLGNYKAGCRLTLINRETLKATIHGKENIFWRSFIEINEGFIYSIILDGNDFYLGRFNSNLKLTARSKDRINENTFISFYGDKIYINRHDKRILVLNKKDLATIGIVNP